MQEIEGGNVPKILSRLGSSNEKVDLEWSFVFEY